jgi:hypothetical protein
MKNLDDLPLPSNGFDLDDLLHPARAFEHPRHVLADPDLTVNEKRAILASWASDACAVEAAPALRCAPGGRQPVSVDEILEALRDLDRQARASCGGLALAPPCARHGRAIPLVPSPGPRT